MQHDCFHEFNMVQQYATAQANKVVYRSRGSRFCQVICIAPLHGTLRAGASYSRVVWASKGQQVHMVGVVHTQQCMYAAVHGHSSALAQYSMAYNHASSCSAVQVTCISLEPAHPVNNGGEDDGLQ